MLELWGILTPILITDALNPVLLAAIVYALGTTRPFVASSMMLTGHTAAYLVSGIVLALALDQIISVFENPKPWHFAAGGLIGIVLVVLAVASLRSREKPSEKEASTASDVRPWSAFTIGAMVSMTGLPFAVPYLAAIDQILRADLSTISGLLVLIAYNVLYAVPFLLLILVRRVYRRESERTLGVIMVWVDRIAAVVVPVVLFGLGAFMLADAGLFFWRGEGLY